MGTTGGDESTGSTGQHLGQEVGVPHSWSGRGAETACSPAATYNRLIEGGARPPKPRKRPRPAEQGHAGSEDQAPDESGPRVCAPRTNPAALGANGGGVDGRGSSPDGRRGSKADNFHQLSCIRQEGQMSNPSPVGLPAPKPAPRQRHRSRHRLLLQRPFPRRMGPSTTRMPGTSAVAPAALADPSEHNASRIPSTDRPVPPGRGLGAWSTPRRRLAAGWTCFGVGVRPLHCLLGASLQRGRHSPLADGGPYWSQASAIPHGGAAVLVRDWLPLYVVLAVYALLRGYASHVLWGPFRTAAGCLRHLHRRRPATDGHLATMAVPCGQHSAVGLFRMAYLHEPFLHQLHRCRRPVEARPCAAFADSSPSGSA